jgi:recombination protein RecA
MFNEGISKVGDMLDIGTDLEIVTKRGAFFTYNDTKLGQGRENAKEFLKQNPEIAGVIEKEIRQHAAEAQQLTRLGKSGTAVEVESDTTEDEE